MQNMSFFFFPRSVKYTDVQSHTHTHTDYDPFKNRTRIVNTGSMGTFRRKEGTAALLLHISLIFAFTEVQMDRWKRNARARARARVCVCVLKLK